MLQHVQSLFTVGPLIYKNMHNISSTQLTIRGDRIDFDQ